MAMPSSSASARILGYFYAPSAPRPRWTPGVTVVARLRPTLASRVEHIGTITAMGLESPPVFSYFKNECHCSPEPGELPDQAIRYSSAGSRLALARRKMLNRPALRGLDETEIRYLQIGQYDKHLGRKKWF